MLYATVEHEGQPFFPNEDSQQHLYLSLGLLDGIRLILSSSKKGLAAYIHSCASSDSCNCRCELVSLGVSLGFGESSSKDLQKTLFKTISMGTGPSLRNLIRSLLYGKKDLVLFTKIKGIKKLS